MDLILIDPSSVALEVKKYPHETFEVLKTSNG